mmetsp:Transcript_133997/g.428165  ORF Transcript_133997/g.428165 Transcript_133997/m.428165 type:complete len:234 (-) Transcript_133997:1116-1817(-)
MLEAVVREVANHVETLIGRDIPMPLFFHLREQPRLHQRATADHDRINTMIGQVLICLFPTQDVTTSDERDARVGASLRALVDVVPVGELGVALACSATVQGDGAYAPLLKLRQELVRVAAPELGVLFEILVVGGSHLQGQRLRLQDGGHATDDALHGLRACHEAGARPSSVQLVQGATAIDVDEVAVHLLVHELRHPRHVLHVAARKLDAEALLALVPAQQRELGGGALEDAA